MSIVEDVLKNRSPKPRFTVLSSIANRFSPRVFNDTDLSIKHIQEIFEAARLAPSGRNNQPWFFYIIKKDSSSYEKIKLCIPERNRWALSAPLIILACYNPTEPNSKPNKWAQYDLGAAVNSLILQAQELGIYSRQIGSFDTEEAKKQYNIQDPLIPFTLIAMGKMGNEDNYIKAEETYVEKDLTPTGRKEKIFEELP
jgi:nitroreductase